ncbi:hypothetical protein E4U42_002551 [Claviceps africana]|uniref:Acetylxylan esterase n=1 Tax=Claviceps africana TaxID=83212 RepID=A0A8K0JE19_9HYPO|nr:hypothetical protein E4U42_002551 [Claviceps africana]
MVARGSLENPGTGALNSLVELITKRHLEATIHAFRYPAGLEHYQQSVAAGTQAVTRQLTSYVRRCPNSQVVVLGYSQGAHVTGDALCGGKAIDTEDFTPPLDDDISSRIAAIVWYGDPRHVAGKPFNKGNATTDGIFARKEGQSCDKFSDILASYCDDGDMFCANRGSDYMVHMTYPERYDAQAADFVLDRLPMK